METLEKGVKYVQSEQQKHQNDVIDVVLVFLSLISTFFTPFSSVPIGAFEQKNKKMLAGKPFEEWKFNFETLCCCDRNTLFSSLNKPQPRSFAKVRSHLCADAIFFLNSKLVSLFFDIL